MWLICIIMIYLGGCSTLPLRHRWWYASNPCRLIFYAYLFIFYPFDFCWMKTDAGRNVVVSQIGWNNFEEGKKFQIKMQSTCWGSKCASMVPAYSKKEIKWKGQGMNKHQSVNWMINEYRNGLKTVGKLINMLFDKLQPVL